MQQRKTCESQGQCLTKINHENLYCSRRENGWNFAQTQTPENLCTGWLFIMDVLKSSQGNKTFKTIPI